MARRTPCPSPTSANAAPPASTPRSTTSRPASNGPRDEIRRRREAIEAHALTWTAVESVPVSEAIKTHGPDCAAHIAAYARTLENLAAEGIRVVIYNFMPVLDWVRTDMAWRMPDGSECLRYVPAHFAAFELYLLRRPGAERDYTPAQLSAAETWFSTLNADQRQAFERSIIDVFPGTKLDLSIDDIRRMLARYESIDAARLRRHHAAFLQAVAPVAERVGLRLAVHPDDPPFPILGLPRIVSTEADFDAIRAASPEPANGFCFCTGSLGARADNDLPGIVRRRGEHIHAVHLRSVQREPDGSFHEAAHLEGDARMPAVMFELLRVNARRAPDARLSLRPDHGRRLLDDLKKPPLQTPGYDCLGRLRGLAELRGLQTGLLHAGVS